MSAINPKNFALSPAGSDLGLGDQLTIQMTTQELEIRRKKMLEKSAEIAGTADKSPAQLDLFGGLMNGS